MFPHGLKPTIALLLCVTVHIAFPWLVSLLHDSKLRTVVLNHSTGWSGCLLQWLLDTCLKFSLNLQRFTAQWLNWIAIDWFVFMNLTLAQLMKTFAIYILLHCLQVYLLGKKSWLSLLFADKLRFSHSEPFLAEAVLNNCFSELQAVQHRGTIAKPTGARMEAHVSTSGAPTSVSAPCSMEGRTASKVGCKDLSVCHLIPLPVTDISEHLCPTVAV